MWRFDKFERDPFENRKEEKIEEGNRENSDRSRTFYRFYRALDFSIERYRHRLNPIPVPFSAIPLKGSEFCVMGLFLVPDYPILAARKHSSVERFARTIPRDLSPSLFLSFSLWVSCSLVLFPLARFPIFILALLSLASASGFLCPVFALSIEYTYTVFFFLLLHITLTA